ncbi:undecaprenyl-diphosphatase [Tamaricihabitans halophyticus]|uniref:Undecaprenyl-diphosphatase n=1 Tax=Tamaricihabitans halophyticus TaxID=1262583 RepID=A0A4V2STJ2_9PSEU|nr:undecaprenyl-diphosphate phosphatase [Tamaricihabitans halophyticus]TCP50986.1 undecaprenyl-diphosphatase [Tamaricihabitans halophyticus]
MTWLETLVLGLVQGLTEFLPISSSAHVRIVSELFFGGDAGASYTAVIQLGTELAVLLYFMKDIVRLLRIWFRGLVSAEARQDPDYKLAWYIIIGSLPIAVLGYLFQDAIRTSLRNLWITATVLIVFALLLMVADRLGRQERDNLTLRDSLAMGFAQCLALIPGVSRSGGTLTAGLAVGLRRPQATRYTFLLAIPAVFGAGVFSIFDLFSAEHVGKEASIAQTIVGTGMAFAVGYASIAWLMKYVTTHSYALFVWYRLVIGGAVMLLLTTGTLTPT